MCSLLSHCVVFIRKHPPQIYGFVYAVASFVHVCLSHEIQRSDAGKSGVRGGLRIIEIHNLFTMLWFERDGVRLYERYEGKKWRLAVIKNPAKVIPRRRVVRRK